MAPSGTGDDAESTGATGVGVRGVCGLAAVGNDSHLGKRGQPPEVAVINPSYLEHIMRTHDNAIPFPFAASVIDNRSPRAFVGIAPLPGSVGVLRRPAFLGQDEFRRFR
jgi:hypothetical protein